MRQASTGRWCAKSGRRRRGRGGPRGRRPRRGGECRDEGCHDEGLCGYFSLPSNTPERLGYGVGDNRVHVGRTGRCGLDWMRHPENGHRCLKPTVS